MKRLFIRKTGDFTTSLSTARLCLAALIVGAVCALIAIILLKMIYFLTNLFFYHTLSFAYATATHNTLHAWSILPPVIGALLIGFIARYGSEKIRGHGIPEAIEAMLTNGSKVHPKVAFWKPISAAISIGSGGPFGAEGPIIMTGGSFGSLFGQFFHLTSMERRILLVAGAAGGMSATFASPIAAVLFAVELLVFEFKPRSLVPIALASAVADAIRVIFLGAGPIFPMPMLGSVHWGLIVASAGIGLCGSVLAMLLTWAIYAVEDAFRKLPMHWMWWPAIGAVVIGVGGWICPRALGVGYDSISAMLNVKLTLAALAVLMVVKSVIWIVALGSGTSGGILAPILIIGGSLGEVAGRLLHVPHPEVWALLGMSSIFAGVTRTPFTSIIFPLELTHNLDALLPLLITSSIATGLSAMILPRSILTEKIARRGLHLTREYHADPLQMHYCRAIAWFPELAFQEHETLEAVSQRMLMAEPPTEWASVLDSQGRWMGAVSGWEMVKRATVNPHALVGESLVHPPMLQGTNTAKEALDALLQHDVKWALVVDPDQTIGMVTIDGLLQLRKKHHEEENLKARIIRLPLWFPKPKPIQQPNSDQAMSS